MRNYQIYPYFLRDGVVLHDTGVGTVPNKQNFASTAKRWLPHQPLPVVTAACHHHCCHAAAVAVLEACGFFLASGAPTDNQHWPLGYTPQHDEFTEISHNQNRSKCLSYMYSP